MAPASNRRPPRTRTAAAGSMPAAVPSAIGAPVTINLLRSPRPGWTVTLQVRLAHRPLPTATTVDDLVIGGRLTLPVALIACGAGNDPGPRAIYFRSVRFSLMDGAVTLASADSKGRDPAALLSATLDRATTLQAIRALAGRSTSLEVVVVSADVRTPLPLLRVPLADLMRDLAQRGGSAETLDSWVVLTAPDPGDGDYRPIPIRLAGERRDVRTGRPVVAPMGRGFGSITAVAAVSRISAAPAHAIAVHPSVTATSALHHATLASDLVFTPPDTRPRLPQIDDQAAEVWRDHVEPSSYWYLPAFRLLQPDPARPASESPFIYRFEESGHDAEGRPGLNATITFTLQQEPGDAVTRKLADLGNPSARPVPFENLAVSLSIPFRDAQGRTRREIVTATTERTGDPLVATVALLDSWARLAYGALAVDGFQSEPPRIRVDVCFAAMVPQGTGVQWLSVVSKQELLPLTLAAHRALDGDVTLQTAAGGVSFARESAQESRATRPLSTAQTMAVHGQLHSQVLAASGIRATIYAQQSIARSREMACVFPCETRGGFYLQTTDEGDVAVGCQDALKLGQTDYRLYAPVEDARIPRHVRVFRSLMQPGRFLLAPAAYKVARFDADAGDRAFRPAIFLYSSLDASVPANNHAALMATLGPDVAAHDIERVRDLLRELAPAPTLQLLTEIAADLSYTWSVANGEIVKEQRVIRRWDSFQVSMAADLEQVPLLESMLNTNGIAIVATFTLPDASKIATTLDLNLNGVVGPIGRTPIDVARAADGATVVNRIECDVDVDDLLAIDDEAAPGHSAITAVPVERMLAPGESASIQAEIPATARLVLAATPKSSATTLAEIRSFVEDIRTRVAFINLLNFDNHNLAAIAIEARIAQLPESYGTTLGATDTVQTVEMVLPLTRYLAQPVLQFQASVTRRDGSVRQTSWIDWPLDNKGNVVGITWELLGIPN